MGKELCVCVGGGACKREGECERKVTSEGEMREHLERKRGES